MTTQSYANTGGIGSRSSIITITTTASVGGGAVTDLLNGDTGENSFWWTNGQSSKVVHLDFGSGKSYLITEFTWWQSGGATHGTWVWEGSNDDSSWTGIGSSFTLGGSAGANVYTQGGSTGYRYYRLRQTAGTTSDGPFLRELTFKISDQAATSATTSYANTGGTGNRTSIITATSNMVSSNPDLGTGHTFNSTDLAVLVDGTTGSDQRQPANDANNTGDRWLMFDFGVSASKVIDELKFYFSGADTRMDDADYSIEGSDDGSTFTTLASRVHLATDATTIISWPNTTGYRYYRLHTTSFTGDGGAGTWYREVEFKIDNAAAPTTVRVYKDTEYAVLLAPSTPVDTYKVTEYAVLAVTEKVSKVTEYAVLEPPPPEVEFTPLEGHFDGQPLAAYHDPQPAGLIAGTEAFVSDTGQFTKYTESSAGTFTVSGTGQIVHNSGSFTDRNDIITLTGEEFSIPNGFVSVQAPTHGTTSGGYDNIGVGIFKDANNFVCASFDTVANLARVQIKISGSNNFTGSVGHTLAIPAEIGFSLVGNRVGVYVKLAGVWTYLTSADVSGFYDFKTTGNLTGWKVGFTLASRDNSTWDFDNLKWGSAGGVGMRDMTIVTNEDGTTYVENNRYVYFTATVAAPQGVDGSYCGVFKLDHNNLSYAQTGVIYVERSSKYQNDQACHLIAYPNGDTRITIATWGNGFSSTLQVQHKLETGVDLLNGVHSVASMSTLSLPLSTQFFASGAYDSFLVYDDVNAQWLIAYAVVDNTNFSGSPFYPVAATSPDLTTWTIVDEDSSGAHSFEGMKILRSSPAAPFYIMAGGEVGDGILTRVYDQDMNFLGALDCALWGGTDTQPHPMVYSLRSKYFLLTFNNTKGTAADFSWGQPTLQSANRYVADNYQKPLTDDFDVDGPIDTGKWTWRHQSTATAIITGGVLELAVPAGASFAPRSVEQTLPSNKVKLRIKITSDFTDSNFAGGGFYVKNAGSDKAIFFGYNRSGGSNFEGYRATTTAFGSGLGLFSQVGNYHDDPKYFEIECDGTNLYLRSSVDGCTWTTRYTEALASYVIDIDTVGLFANSENSNPVSIFFSWFHDVTPTEWVKKVTEYAVLEPVSTPLDVYKATEYAVIQPAAQAKKVTEYAIIAPVSDAFVFKSTEYAVIQRPRPDVYKVTEYAVLVTNVKGYKATEYAILAPTPVGRGYKVTQYALIVPPPPISQFTELITLSDVIPTGAFTHYFLNDFSNLGDPAPRFQLVLYAKLDGAPEITQVKYVIQDFNMAIPFDPLSVSASSPISYDLPVSMWLAPEGSGLVLKDAVFDAANRSIGLFAQDDLSNNHYMLFDLYGDFPLGVIAAPTIPLPNNHSFNPRRADASHDYRYISGDQLVTIEERPQLTYRVDDRTVSGLGAPAYAGAQWYDGARRSITYVDVNGNLTTIFTSKFSGAATTVAKIIRRIMTKAGIPEEYYDVSQVEDISIEGYLVRDQNSVMEVIKELVNFFHISMVDSGGRLAFRPLATADTVLVDPNHFHTLSTTRAVDVSDEITSAEVTYYDLDQDDNSAVAVVTRDQFTDLPDYVANSDPVTYKAAVFTTATRARQSAEIYLNTYTSRLDTRKIYLAPYHLAMEPGDLIGSNFRVNKVSINVNLEMAVDADIDSPADYAVTGITSADLLSFVDTTLKDYDHGTKNYPVGFSLNPNQYGALNNMVYVGLVNPDVGTFIGTQIVLRQQLGRPLRLATPSVELVYGHVDNPPLAGRTNMFTTDHESQLVIVFNKDVPAGVIASLTDLTPFYTDVNRNLLIVGRELIQYQTASIAGDNKTVTFTGLGRGRFGTDEFADSHTVGEAAAVYTAESMLQVDIPSGISDFGVANFITYDVRATRLYNSEEVQVYRAIARSWNIGRVNIYKKNTDGIYFRVVTRLPYANGFADGETDLNTSYGQTPFIAILRAPFDIDLFMASFQQNPLFDYSTDPYIARVLDCGTGNTAMSGSTEVADLFQHSIYSLTHMAADGVTLTDDIYVAAFILDTADSASTLKSPVRGFRFEGSGHYSTGFKTGLDA